jgi:hypothetical protein
MEERFFAKVNKTETCWLWTGCKRPGGYGQVTINKKAYSTNRISYEMHKGKIPDGLIIRHKCDIPSCVNPDHLEIGTHKDNTRDMIERGRRKGNIKLTEEQVKEVKELLKLGKTQREIAKQFKINQGTVQHINSGKSWNS